MDAAQKFIAKQPHPTPANPLARLADAWCAAWKTTLEAARAAEAGNVLEDINAELEKMRQRKLAFEAWQAEHPEYYDDEEDDEEPFDLPSYCQPEPDPKPPRVAPLGSPLATEWLVHLEEGRIGPRIRRIED